MQMARADARDPSAHTPVESTRERTMKGNNGAAAGSGALYSLGILGAWVYFWQQADSFWEYALAILEGLFWPAWMVYYVFAALHA
jgi:hypothetical protein